jgi:hypothetical protein
MRRRKTKTQLNKGKEQVRREIEQDITNTPPIDKMYIYLLCPQSEDQNNPFQSKQSKHFHQRNWFTLCETGSNKVKLPKVRSNVIESLSPLRSHRMVEK